MNKKAALDQIETAVVPWWVWIILTVILVAAVVYLVSRLTS